MLDNPEINAFTSMHEDVMFEHAEREWNGKFRVCEFPEAEPRNLYRLIVISKRLLD